MYEAYLCSPEWNLKRKYVLERDKHRCRFCGNTKFQAKLEVHHPPWTYELLGEEDPADLTTMCDLCHKTLSEELRERNRQKNY